jgi:hypothetical protein
LQRNLTALGCENDLADRTATFQRLEGFSSVRGKVLGAKSFTSPLEITLRRDGTHSAIRSGANDGALKPISDWFL